MSIFQIINSEAVSISAIETAQEKTGAGFGNSEINRQVEQAAIFSVTKEYQNNDWTVESVEAEKCGFDLLCLKGEIQEHVEVKGIQGDLLSFIITSGEVKCSQTDENFVLCIVTSALTTPKLHKFTAAEFAKRFSLETISYRAALRQ